ncbi:MAG: HAD-IB family hydrolase [Spirochaetales bacterium]|nr:HAD-IB family hydrolase [Spirochaetales bacterium]
MKSNGEKPAEGEAAFFDIDKTLISVFSEQAFALRMLKKGHLGFHKVLLILFSYIVYSLIEIKDHEKTKKAAVRLIMKNQPVEKSNRLYDEYFQSTLQYTIYDEMKKEIERHRREGRKLVLISSSVDLIVSRFRDHLNFDKYYAARLEKKDCLYTGEILGRVFNGRRKAEAVREFAEAEKIDLKKSYAYGDYRDDRYMLELVGHPVAVNPDKTLKQIAGERGWAIMNPVHARSTH